MESLSLNSEERELQQMKLVERQLHSNCMARFKELKTHLEFLHNINSVTVEACLGTEGAVLEACLANEGIAMDDNLIAKESTNNSTSSEQHNKCNRSGNENKSSNNESSSAGNNADADIRPSNDNDIVLEESIKRMMKIIDLLSLDSRSGKPMNEMVLTKIRMGLVD
nr:hypothetical protein [Tanacetum cinerariifolium]GEY16551.1 hypothetical protein [Tanacetum cinerariifolium]